jgi:DNA-binding GntR family transcriptional regulator
VSSAALDSLTSEGAGVAATLQGTGLAEALREEIIAGVLPPSVRLRQGEIGRRYGVSRTPVREALQKLHAWGLVELSANRSAVVRPLRRRDYEGAFTVRAELEGLAAELAVPRMTIKEVEELRKAVRLFEQVVEHTVDTGARRWSNERAEAIWAQADELFHETIVSAADSARLRTTIELAAGLVPRRRLWEVLGWSSSRVRAICRHHATVLAYAENREARDAGDAMRKHVLAEATIFLEWFDRFEAPMPEPA